VIQNSFNFEPFDIDSQVRSTLAAMMKPYSRSWIAEEVSRLTRHEISESTLNNWAAPSQNGTRCVSFFAVPALSQVTKSTALWNLGSKPIQGLLSKTRIEELASLDEAERRIHARRAELEGRNV
jgi:hypothetical protein